MAKRQGYFQAIGALCSPSDYPLTKIYEVDRAVQMIRDILSLKTLEFDTVSSDCLRGYIESLDWISRHFIRMTSERTLWWSFLMYLVDPLLGE